ncbi:YegP family protein [Arthrobacter antioxidans]|uniref:YegP family protein n=1 Tax=Arthrobacter antioxidans TaxID=2895818 RepID=UPI001FFECEC9|nr:YegP family protein [Arthrobacter antioxidans]
MAGTFELFHDGGTSFGFRLTAPDGEVVAVSGQFSNKASAVEGIRAVRECAGTGLITDLCPPIPYEAVAEKPGPSQDLSVGHQMAHRR